MITTDIRMASGISQLNEPPLKGELAELVGLEDAFQQSLIVWNPFLKLVFRNIRQSNIATRVSDGYTENIVFVPILRHLLVAHELNLKRIGITVADSIVESLNKPLLLKGVADPPSISAAISQISDGYCCAWAESLLRRNVVVRCSDNSKVTVIVALLCGESIGVHPESRASVSGPICFNPIKEGGSLISQYYWFVIYARE